MASKHTTTKGKAREAQEDLRRHNRKTDAVKQQCSSAE